MQTFVNYSNMNKKFSQTCEPRTAIKSSELVPPKKILSFTILIHDLNYYRRRSTTKTKVFASLRNSDNFTTHRRKTLVSFEMSIHDFSWTKLFVPPLFTSCKHRHRQYMGIIQIIFQTTVMKAYTYVTSRCCDETWSLKFHMISRSTTHYRQAVLFVAHR